MRSRIMVGIIASLILALPANAADDPKAVEAKIQAYLKTIEGSDRGALMMVQDEHLAKAFPKHAFAGLIFRQFPVGRPIPEPFKLGNVLIIPPGEGKIVAITDVKQLEKYFIENAPKANATVGETVLLSWLRLTQDLAQDGFYKFMAPKGGIGTASSDGKMQLAGNTVVDPAGGNKGEISAKMHFLNGALEKIEHKVDLSPGPRPRCQATKLLDADPIVRQMAEDSIRVMGRACRYYLDEQRAKATPELQKAIDRIWQRILDEGR